MKKNNSITIGFITIISIILIMFFLCVYFYSRMLSYMPKENTNITIDSKE